MTRGDVPLNLTATSLVAHAWLYTGEDRFRQWILEYNRARAERTRHHGGIISDNVGLDGEIGQYTGGRWWSGYYGWLGRTVPATFSRSSLSQVQPRFWPRARATGRTGPDHGASSGMRLSLTV